MSALLFSGCPFVFSTWVSLDWIDHARRPKLCKTEYSPKRDRRTSLRERRHHCLEHRVWDHTPERAPEGCTIGISAYLPARMDRSFYRARHKPPVPYLFDPRGAGWLLLRIRRPSVPRTSVRTRDS